MAKRVESPSSINTFKQCQRKYYYQYIAGLPTLPNIHQVRGNIAHSTLEHFYNTDLRDISTEDHTQKFKTRIQQLLLQYWQSSSAQLQKLHLHPDLEKFYFEETMLMVMNWINHFLEELPRPPCFSRACNETPRHLNCHQIMTSDDIRYRFQPCNIHCVSMITNMSNIVPFRFDAQNYRENNKFIKVTKPFF